MSVVVTILTGRRPVLLHRTLEAFSKLEPWWWDRVVAFHNGNDAASAEILNHWVDWWDWTNDWLPIGEATSRCAQLAQGSEAKFWLHLEDDWEALKAPRGWLGECCGLLDSGKVDQVRLRDASETVLKRHMVTGQPIKWTQEGHFDIGEAHLTFNPFLMRVSDIGDAFPCEGEVDAQRKWLAAGHKMVAQHHPGIWRHIGGNDSLRGGQR